LKLKDKIEKFNNLCGDWDFRNIDMTSPHLQGISIKENTINVGGELFSPELDDYVSCNAGSFVNRELVNQFKKLDLDNNKDVIKFIKDIEDLVNWNEVSDELYSQVEKENNYEI